jgi:hypothetical protein
MVNLQGKTGELHMTIEVTRKETGKVEVYELVGHVVEEEDKEQEKELKNG